MHRQTLSVHHLTIISLSAAVLLLLLAPPLKSRCATIGSGKKWFFLFCFNFTQSKTGFWLGIDTFRYRIPFFIFSVGFSQATFCPIVIIKCHSDFPSILFHFRSSVNLAVFTTALQHSTNTTLPRHSSQPFQHHNCMSCELSWNRRMTFSEKRILFLDFQHTGLRKRYSKNVSPDLPLASPVTKLLKAVTIADSRNKMNTQSGLLKSSVPTYLPCMERSSARTAYLLRMWWHASLLMFVLNCNKKRFCHHQ